VAISADNIVETGVSEVLDTEATDFESQMSFRIFGIGAKEIDGTNASETLRGSGDDDIIRAFAGDDIITDLGTGGDSVEGGNGNDTIYLTSGDINEADAAHGGNGNDTIHMNVNSKGYGGDGNDIYYVDLVPDSRNASAIAYGINPEHMIIDDNGGNDTAYLTVRPDEITKYDVSAPNAHGHVTVYYEGQALDNIRGIENIIVTTDTSRN
jgi:Ca2+-binding RTX toxin-like protein